MKKIALSAILAVTMASAGGDVAPIAKVDKNFYVGGSLQAVTISLDDSDSDFATLSNTEYGLGVQAGWIFFRSGDFSTALEGRYSYSWDNDDLGDTQILSGFVKPEYNFGALAVYALVGYSYLDTDGFGDYDGFTWGLGAEVPVSDNLAVFVDYTNTPNVDTNTRLGGKDFDYDVITVGMNYKF